MGSAARQVIQMLARKPRALLTELCQRESQCVAPRNALTNSASVHKSISSRSAAVYGGNYNRMIARSCRIDDGIIENLKFQ